MIIIVIIFGIIYIVAMYFLYKKTDRNYRKHLFIYPKNGREYYVNAIIRMKKS